jgi:hypothetical protein
MINLTFTTQSIRMAKRHGKSIIEFMLHLPLIFKVYMKITKSK